MVVLLNLRTNVGREEEIILQKWIDIFERLYDFHDLHFYNLGLAKNTRLQ